VSLRKQWYEREPRTPREPFDRSMYSAEELDKKDNPEKYEKIHLRRQAKIPQHFCRVRLSDYQISSEKDETVVAFLEGYAENYRNYLPYENLDHRDTIGHGIVLEGPPDRGKTMLACAVLGEILDRQVESAPPQERKIFRSRYVPMAQYAKDARLSNGPEGDLDVDAAYRRKRLADDAWFLVLDDVGKEYVTSSRFIQKELAYLLRSRYDRGKPTIITTNEPLSVWADSYDAATTSFVERTNYFFEDVGVNREERESVDERAAWGGRNRSTHKDKTRTERAEKRERQKRKKEEEGS